MSGTIVTQNRYARNTDTGTKYEISAVCTASGPPPDQHIFVFQITDFDDPKNDTFFRVADSNDFLNIGADRNEVLENNTTVEGAFLYRTTSNTQAYDSVDLANGAWQALSSRINDLVLEYDTYINFFLTPPEGAVTTYPTVDESTKAALIADYEASLPAVDAAEAARDAENIACEALQLEYKTMQERLTEAQSDLAAMTPITSSLGASAPSLSVIGASLSATFASLTSQVAGSGASAGDKSAMDATIASGNTQVSALSTTANSVTNDVYNPLVTFQSTLQTRAASLQSDVTAMTLEVNDCILQVATLQAAVDTARNTRDEALVAVRAVCVDYVPS